MTTRYRAGRSLVISVIALARSFSGIVPHLSANVLSCCSVTVPLPSPPRIALSGALLLGRIVPPPGLLHCPPPGQAPPLDCPPFAWFSRSLISSSRRKTIFF